MSEKESEKTPDANSRRTERTDDVLYRRRTVLRLAGAFAGVGLGERTIAGEVAASEYTTGQEVTTQQGPIDIDCNEWTEGELSADGGDGPRRLRDVYRFQADAETVVSVEMSAIDGEGDPSILLYDIEGNLFAQDDDSGGGLDARTPPVTLPERDTFFIFAFGDLPPSGTLRYNLRLNCHEQYDTEAIECGRSVTGALTVDAPTGFRGSEFFFETYAFSVDETQRVTASLAATVPDESETSETKGEASLPDGVAGDPYLYLIDPDGLIIDQDDDSGGFPNALLRRTLRKQGEYVLVVTSSNPGETFGYELSLECGPIETTLFECGETIVGELTDNDERGFRPPSYWFSPPDYYFDAYRFEGTEGEYLELEMAVEGTSLVQAAYLYLLDPSGNVIVGSDAPIGQSNTPVEIRLPSDGTYTVIVTSSTPGRTFEYELTTNCRTREEVIGPTEAIECGDFVAGELTGDDATGFRGPGYVHDAYRFRASAGDSVRILMSSFGNAPYLYLLGPKNDVIAEGGNGDEAQIQNFEIETSGRYTVIATSSTPGRTFDYRLSLQCRPVFYQVDLVAGEPERRLGEHPGDFYSAQQRLIRYLHGGTPTPVARQGTPPSLAPNIANCVDSEPMRVSQGTASVTFTIKEGCEQYITLASYRKPTPGWNPNDPDEQRLFDSQGGRFGPGTHVLDVYLPLFR